MAKKETKRQAWERMMKSAGQILRQQAVATNELLADKAVAIPKCVGNHDTDPLTGRHGITGLIVACLIERQAVLPDDTSEETVRAKGLTREEVAAYVWRVMHRDDYEGPSTRYVTSVGVYLSDRLNQPDAAHPRRKGILRGGCVAGGAGGRKQARYWIPASLLAKARAAAGYRDAQAVA